MIKETMSELISNVNSCLEENDSKIKEIEEKVDEFIEKEKQKINESNSAPLFKSYTSKESYSFGDIFKPSYEGVKQDTKLDTKMAQSYSLDKPYSNMMSGGIPQYPPTQEGYFTGARMSPEFIDQMKPKETQWSPYQMSEYPQQYPYKTSVFPEPMQPQYRDPEIEANNKMLQGLQYALDNNINCLFSNEAIYFQMCGMGNCLTNRFDLEIQT